MCACRKKFDFISNKLKVEANAAIKWLKNNEMSKFRLAFLPKYKIIEENMTFTGKTAKSSDMVGKLCITLDRNINL